MGPSIKYVTLFWTNFDPLPLSHIVTHLGTPIKYVAHLGLPRIFSSRPTCIHTVYIFLYREVCLNSRGSCLGSFVRGFLSGRFSSGWFLSVPSLPEYIRCNRKLNITFNYRFHMYEKI